MQTKSLCSENKYQVRVKRYSGKNHRVNHKASTSCHHTSLIAFIALHLFASPDFLWSLRPPGCIYTHDLRALHMEVCRG
ncbi:unnamed protein product [Ectocarpus sp. CCAP 1310/34]|nr:unnamed protein product [Ectocarpus sp. CCAP 1310/34]